MKQCYRCRLTKPFSEFYRDPGRKDSYSHRCKACAKIEYQERKQRQQDLLPEKRATHAQHQRERYHQRARELGTSRLSPVEAPEGMKHCHACEHIKPLADFYRNHRKQDGRSPRCKACETDASKQRRKTNAAQWLQTQKHFGQAGMTKQRYDQLMEEQDGVCAICGNPQRRRDGKTVRLAVDHDHETGAIRGLLCNTCNTGLGYFADSIERLQAAAVYLSTHQARQQPLSA